MRENTGFTYRYAIRRPDGELIRQPKSDSFMSGLFGPSIFPTNDDDTPPPRTWDTREAADRALEGLRKQAAGMGISDWLGVVVQQLCTPFTLHDPAEDFAREVQDWLRRGGK